MVLGAFGGTSMYVRKSTTLTEEAKCYSPWVTCSKDHLAAVSGVTEYIDYSENAQASLPDSSKLQNTLNFCNLSGCALYDVGCSTLSTSTKIVISGSTPNSITVNDANTLYEWREQKCMKCSHNGQPVSFDGITFIKQEKPGICKWYQVKRLP